MASTQDGIPSSIDRNQVVDITTIGRRSGQPRRLEIFMHSIGGRLYISGMPRPEKRSWLANLELDPHLTLHLKQGIEVDLAATARVIDDQSERRAVLTEVARTWQRSDVPTMVRMSPLIEVTLDRR
ncbi:MAG: nitroreductase family deazaflavin-dependent oxidoreductase [Candidatus Dormibacteraeota bacterium]|nr:nitroreductase family deazaflavin-dependent oxidoreductase [Candidatus Dormibacteraeota bacterium]